MKNPIDRVLVETWLIARDEAAFRLIYYRHKNAVWRVAIRLCNGDQLKAEEIVQDTWIRAIEKVQEFKWQSSFKTWLIGILINRWREELRKDSYLEKMQVNIKLQDQVYEIPHETKMDIERTFEALPLEYKEVITLYDIEGFKHKEIAEMLGIAEGTSKSRLSDARSAFKKRFGKLVSH
ncbi:MAG: RNA polymerase sigma factor [Saprospiraceae bacterium]|nr:RNA polymerase sigma factor [Saprospiraceae bacterium]